MSSNTSIVAFAAIAFGFKIATLRKKAAVLITVPSALTQPTDFRSEGAVIANRYVVVQGPLENPRLRGGMGAVYLCADSGMDGLPLALKTFHRELLGVRRDCSAPRLARL